MYLFWNRLPRKKRNGGALVVAVLHLLPPSDLEIGLRTVSASHIYAGNSSPFKRISPLLQCYGIHGRGRRVGFHRRAEAVAPQFQLRVFPSRLLNPAQINSAHTRFPRKSVPRRATGDHESQYLPSLHVPRRWTPEQTPVESVHIYV